METKNKKEELKETQNENSKTIANEENFATNEEPSNLQANRVKKKRAFDELDKDDFVEKKSTFRSFFFQGHDGYDIYVRTWDNISQAKAVILLAHGMVEHGLRYDEFARYLNGRGYILVVPDCRGHGRTAGAPNMVSIYSGDLFNDIVRDNMKLADTLTASYKLPLIVMGHSFGSFITQAFIQNYHTHSGVIIMGSSCFKGRMDAYAGKFIAKVTKAFCGADARAKLIYKMTFGAYGKGKKDGNWLTHDEERYKDYMLDPYCGAVCSAQFYRSFFGGLTNLYKKSGLNMIDKNLPMLITSGDSDPLGGKNHKMIDKLPTLYKNIGVQDVTYKLWKDGYHEILNETFREDVYDFIANWLDEKITKSPLKDTLDTLNK